MKGDGRSARPKHSVSVLLYVACPPESQSVAFRHLYEVNHRPLLHLLSDSRMPLGVSVPWGLTEQWQRAGSLEALELCEELRRGGQIEFVGSAAYHPILPLLPRQAISRQIAYDVQRHRELFGKWLCAGFVPPEMAFGPELIPLLKEQGYSWCAVDDTTYCCLSDEPPKSHVAECGGLPLLLRSSLWSEALRGTIRDGGCGRALASEMLRGLVDWFQDEPGYVFLAFDAQCLGSHRSGSLRSLSGFLEAVQASAQFDLVRPSEILERFPAQVDEVPPGTWRTTAEQFWEGEFFVPWQSRCNQAQAYMWELTELAVESVARLQERLDRSLHSGIFVSGEDGQGVLADDGAQGVKALLDVISASAPEDLDRALELAANLDNVSP